MPVIGIVEHMRSELVPSMRPSRHEVAPDRLAIDEGVASVFSTDDAVQVGVEVCSVVVVWEM